ncbi:MAG: HDIG domain-containing protein [Phycisphaerae bacterium]|nr:HDIG domain-containing protein [Phycisphaerae bacterium]
MTGDSLTRERLGRLEEEQVQASARTPALDRWIASLGLLGLCTLLAASICLGLAFLRPRVLADASRLSLLFGGMLVLLVAAAFLSTTFPRFTVLVAMSVVVVASASLSLLYDRRIAVVVAVGQSVMLALALGESLAFSLAILLTASSYSWLLRDVRHRSTVVRATFIAALIGAVAVGSVGLVVTPFGLSGALQVLGNAAMAAGGVIVTGFLLVGFLPTLERMLGVITGLTLAELRDPRQPLLRQLQQKAPGTWTHSLQVANIAEAAAEAIGADGLLAYVGALYHDIGKMNKPGYFVENQADGENRHDAITPAMSLLVIIGHVKDGVELAAEYRLPRAVRHMIESHHGTTMVEYFFHLAQRRAARAGDEATEIDENAFRYPGPRPRTREAAILLVCDASESAARTLADPTPARIEQLVRSISRRRLEDGQFDDSPLTFRELRAVEDSIAKSLGSIYHGRIVYPSTSREAMDTDDDARERVGEGDSEAPRGDDAGDARDPRAPGKQPTPGSRRAVA